jgi:hypothetical protein
MQYQRSESKSYDHDAYKSDLKSSYGAPPDAQKGGLPGTGCKQTNQEQAGDHN